MTRDPVTLSPQTAATLALHVMSEVGLRHLPVVENDKVYGMISPTTAQEGSRLRWARWRVAPVGRDSTFPGPR